MTSKCPAGKKPLLINLDETSLGVHVKAGAGTVVTARTPGGLAEMLGTKPTLADLRGAVTHVALVCDEPSLQPLLPQVLIGNKKLFTKKLTKQVVVPKGVHLLSEKTSWNSAAIMVKILGLLAEALEPHRAKFQPVLLLDCCTCHLSRTVLDEARARQLPLVCVPASTTYLLQPLDTRVFQGYKSFLRAGYLQLQTQSAEGRVPPDAWLRLVMEVASKYLRSHSWREAFVSVGAGAADATQLSTALRSRELPFPTGDAPRISQEQLTNLLPKNKRLLLADFSSLDAPRKRLCRKTSSASA